MWRDSSDNSLPLLDRVYEAEEAIQHLTVTHKFHLVDVRTTNVVDNVPLPELCSEEGRYVTKRPV
jgi:hypothetical protein